MEHINDCIKHESIGPINNNCAVNLDYICKDNCCVPYTENTLGQHLKAYDGGINDLIEWLPSFMVNDMLTEALDKVKLHPSHKDYKAFCKGFKMACKIIKKKIRKII